MSNNHHQNPFHHTLHQHHHQRNGTGNRANQVISHRQRSNSWTDWPEDLLTARFHPDLIETKDVLVIGNGPSAITLSYILSGRWPYYCGSKVEKDSENSQESEVQPEVTYEPHPIDFLHERLTHQEDNNNKSLIEYDLDMLSSGLSGRSLNRVSVLFDQLQNPNTDFGNRQKTTIEWRHRPDRAIDHLVLGNGLPGGLWYNLRKSKTILTVSRQKWMQLPEMDIPPELDEDSGEIRFVESLD